MVKQTQTRLDSAEQAQPNVFMRGAKEFRHDLYKSDVGTMKRNTSFQKGVIKIVELEHSHTYHSHNSQGQPQQYSSHVGGHFHEITTAVDSQGNLIAKCGPALREVFRKTPHGQKRRKERVKWNHSGPDSDEVIEDNHRHEFAYQGSEMLSDAKIRGIQNKTQAAVQSMGVKHDPKVETKPDEDLGLEEVD